MSNAKTLHLQFADGEIEVGTLIDALYEQERTIAILRQHKTDYMEAAEGTRKALEAECERLRKQVAALSAQQSAHHPDDVAVERFAAAMKAKLARCREKGRHGWQTASAAHLSSLLYHHMYKADPLDVANLAMMLHQNGQAIELPHEARKPVAQQSAHVSVPRELLQDLRDLASDAVDHHRQAYAGYKLERQANMDQVIANADAILNGGEA